MSKERFNELLKEESSMPSDKTPGMSFKELAGKVWDEFSHVGAHGAHEAAAALFNGSSFVMYPHAGQEQQAHEGHGLPTEANNTQQKEVEGGRDI